MKRALLLGCLALALFLGGIGVGRRQERLKWEGRLEQIADQIPDCVEPPIECQDDPRAAGPHCKDI